jgi:hypothetical protein
MQLPHRLLRVASKWSLNCMSVVRDQFAHPGATTGVSFRHLFDAVIVVLRRYG